MNHRLLVRSGSVVAAASLAVLAAGPALAADPVARASATALEIGIAGQGADTGTYTATHDGSGESTSGTNAPALPVLAGQRATDLGTLAQDATASVTDGTGRSAACAGVAGEGATLVQVGEGSRCLTGGRTITLDAAHADFSKVQLLPAGITQGYDGAVAAAISAAVTPVVGQVLAALGDPGLGIDLGAVQASCTAGAGRASGSTSIAHASAYVEGPAPLGHVTLVDLPVDPAPDTHVVTDLSAVVEAIQQGVDTQIAHALGGADGPLSALTLPLGQTVDTVVDAVQHNVTDALGTQLAPLEQNVLDIVLNKQSRPAADAIEVTALDARVLPAAQQLVDADLARLTIGHVTCGPGGRVAAPAAATPALATPRAPHAGTAVPTAVESGAGSLEDGPSPLALTALGGLVLAGAAAGTWGFRRSLQR